MPVIEHPIHDKVIQKEGFRYGCHSKERSPQNYMVQERAYFSNGWYELKDRFIVNTMSQECRFDMSLTDPGCEDCPWRGSGEKYDAEIRRNGK